MTFSDRFETGPDVRDLAAEVRRLFDELERTGACRHQAAECQLQLDVLETAVAYELRADLPGVRIDSVRLLMKGSTLLIAGEKTPPPSGAEPTTFHLVERSFGRFARAVRLPGAVDGSDVRATLAHGELRVVVPKITERRGQERVVAIQKG